MTEPNQPAAQPATAEVVQSVNAPIPTAKQPGRGLAWMSLFISLAAMLVGVYVWYQVEVDARIQSSRQAHRIATLQSLSSATQIGQSELAEQITQLQQHLEQAKLDFSKQLESLQATRSDKQIEVEQKLDAVIDAIATVEAALQKAQQDALGQSADGWKLAAAEQMLVIANVRLRLSGDVAAARAALEMADSNLAELATPELPDLVAVRRTIGTEVSELAKVPEVDVVNRMADLQTLSNAVDTLPLIGDPAAAPAPTEAEADPEADTEADPAADTETDTAPPEDAAPKGWLARIGAWFSEMMADLAALVQVETEDDLVTPLLSTEQRQLTVDKAQFLLETARWAFMRQQPSLYTTQMQATRAWIQRHFDLEAAPTTAWLARFDKLAAVSPVVELPDISASLDALRRLLAAGEQQ